MLIRSRWRSSIKNIHNPPGPNCLSNHQLLVGNLLIKLLNSGAKETARCLEIIYKEFLFNFSKTSGYKKGPDSDDAD